MTPADANDRPPVALRARPGWFAFGLGAGVTALGGAVQGAAWESSAWREHDVHVAATACLLVLGGRAVIDRGARSLLGRHGPVVAWRALTWGAAALAGYHALRLEHLLTRRWLFFNRFSDLWEGEPEIFFAPVVATLAAYVGARSALPARARLRAELGLSLLAALALNVAAWRRAGSVPAIDAYVPSLPQVGTLPPSSATTGTRARPLSGDGAAESAAASHYADHQVGAVRLRRFSHRGRCAVLRLVEGEPAPTELSPAVDVSHPCEGGAVRVDRARGLYVLVQPSGWHAEVSALETPSAVLGGAVPRGRTMGEFRDRFTVPAGWRWTSAALGVAGIAVLAASAWRRRSGGAPTRWRQATLRADGTIALEGSSAMFLCPHGTAARPGPVVLIDLDEPAEQSPFRGTPQVLPREKLIPGSLADALAERAAAAEADESCAAAAFVMSAAPLVGAAAVRLLG